MKKEYYRILSIALFLILVAGLYIYNLQNDLPGADDNASSVIGLVAPDYKPWIEAIGPDLSKSMERILFGLQMLGGVVLFTICFYYLHKSGKSSKSE